jgi:hypothetical protein
LDVLKAKGIVRNAAMLCEGFVDAEYYMNKVKYLNAASAAFGILARELLEVYTIMSDMTEEKDD